MNTPDPFANEVESLCVEYEDFVLGHRFRTRLRVILARVRAAVMDEAESLAAQEINDIFDREAKAVSKGSGPYSQEFRRANLVEHVCSAIRSAAARILEESRGN